MTGLGARKEDVVVQMKLFASVKEEILSAPSGSPPPSPSQQPHGVPFRSIASRQTA